MEGRTTNVEQILKAILLGAAKILGCTSANLLSVNRETGEIRIRVGTFAARARDLGQVETVFGSDVQETVFHLAQAEDSLVAAAWRERSCYETSSMVELVGSAFPRELVEQVAGMIGALRYICVPVTFGNRIYGVLVLTKEDVQPFGPQRRQILLRYAQRVGEIIDNDLRSRGTFVTRSEPTGDAIQRELLHLALAETAPALMVDPDFRITSFNAATTRLLGYTEDSLEGRPIGDLFKDHAEVTTLLNHQFLFLTDGYYEDLVVVRHASGRFFPGKVRALLLADESDQVMGFLVVIQDLARQTDQLDPDQGAHRLMRRERLATMGELAAQLAHEIRNPLVSIGATLDNLSRREDVAPDLAESLVALTREVTRVDHLLRDYLTLSARRGTRIAPVDVRELVEDARRLIAGGQGANGTRVSAEVQPDLDLLGDYEGLRHVLLNLLRNALEASPRDGRVACIARGDERDVWIDIDDDGPGLSCSSEECLEPFFTTKANGTGMGLTVCQKVLQSHGGTLTLRTRETGGCRASVVLPRKALS